MNLGQTAPRKGYANGRYGTCKQIGYKGPAYAKVAIKEPYSPENHRKTDLHNNVSELESHILQRLTTLAQTTEGDTPRNIKKYYRRNNYYIEGIITVNLPHKRREISPK